jgi:hypothetical protein
MEEESGEEESGEEESGEEDDAPKAAAASGERNTVAAEMKAKQVCRCAPSVTLLAPAGSACGAR